MTQWNDCVNAKRSVVLQAHSRILPRTITKQVRRTYIIDLSTRVQTLDSLLNTSFSGTISPTWAPARTQEWLDDEAPKEQRPLQN